MRQKLFVVRSGFQRHLILQNASVAKRQISIAHNAVFLTGSNKLLSSFCKNETGPHRLYSSLFLVSGYPRIVPVSGRSSATARNYSQLLDRNGCSDTKKSRSRDFPRSFCSESEDTIEDEENDGESEYGEALIDVEYNECIRYYCSIPDAGHRVYVIQPVAKNVRKKSTTTTGDLMLEETCALVDTLPNWHIVGTAQLKVKSPGSRFVFGTGQLEALTNEIRHTPGVSAVFVSLDMLTQIQVNTLQNIWNVPVYDRYTIVLQIFKDHAKSKEAKLQIALAEVPFVRSRIAEKHLLPQDRSKAGGIQIPYGVADGTKYILSRSALLQRKEKKLQAELAKLKTSRAVKRAQRLKKKVPTVAVIGYTNSGKTTLIKALTGDSRMVPEDRLFATLDVTAHVGYLPNRMLALFMDTVGFISNIPHTLYDAFAATLEDAILADLVIHVRDISHPDTEGQHLNVIDTVKGMLSEKQMNTMIEVCNKIDKVSESLPKEDSDCFYISSVTGEGLAELREEIQTRLLSNKGYLTKSMRIPLSGPHLEWLQEEATVTATENDDDYESIIVHIVISEENYARFMARFGPKRSSARR